MSDPISAGLDVIAATEQLIGKLQDEKNTPEMVAAAKRQFIANFSDRIDELQAILADPKESSDRKNKAFGALLILES
jgi:hypothetical protein